MHLVACDYAGEHIVLAAFNAGERARALADALNALNLPDSRYTAYEVSFEPDPDDIIQAEKENV